MADNEQGLAKVETGLSIPVDTGLTDEPEEVIYIDCPRCGRQHVVAATHSPHICVECEKADNSRVSYYRTHQGDWLEACKESGLNAWEQQPNETQWEYTIWCAYRDAFPGKKPSYVDVARQLHVSVGAVKKVAARWTFAMRLQIWMKHVSDVTLAQRHAEILAMNKTHIEMAQKLNKKLAAAIEAIVPETLKPSEIATLAKTAAELERKAQVDTIAQETAMQDLSLGDENPELKKSPTKQDDLKDVIQILMKAGVLGDAQALGVRTTQEIVVKHGEGTETTITSE
jgi:hypothetical protein